jgi:hypothetical protein
MTNEETHAERVEAVAAAQADERAKDAPTDGGRVDPAAESAGMPDKLEERLRAVGATDAEMVRLREEHQDLPYYDRFLANQQAGQFSDDASVFGVLANARAKWKSEDDDPEEAAKAAARAQNVAVDSGTEVATTPRSDAEAAGAPGGGLTPSQVAETQSDGGTTPSNGATDPETSPDPAADQPTELQLREQVPNGTREQVMSWVDEAGDPNQRVLRAQAALYKEQHTDGEEPRKSLVTQLQKAIAG